MVEEALARVTKGLLLRIENTRNDFGPALTDDAAPMMGVSATHECCSGPGRLRLRDCDDCRLLVEQLMMFPNQQYHDDGPDALEMAVRLLQHNRLNTAEPEEMEVYA